MNYLSPDQEGSLKKTIKSLHDKKGRHESGLFLVEGKVSVTEFLHTDYVFRALVVTQDYLDLAREQGFLSIIEERQIPLVITRADLLERMGTLAANQHALAVVEQKKSETSFSEQEIVLVLDRVNDPGNLGTIIRIADWYGIRHIVCSPDTVDVYNPKVVSATKGSLARVVVTYEPLVSLFQKHPTMPVLGADLEGAPLHTYHFPHHGFLLMGSESHGIDPELLSVITQRITIPRYGQAESLNVGIATAVILDTWKYHVPTGKLGDII